MLILYKPLKNTDKIVRPSCKCETQPAPAEMNLTNFISRCRDKATDLLTLYAAGGLV